MNILILTRIIGAIAVVLVIALGYRHIDQSGYNRAMAERDAIEMQATIAAQSKLVAANEKVRITQAALTAAIGTINDKQREFQDEKRKSAVYQSQLASGAVRLRALVAPHQSSGTKQDCGAAAADLDQGTEVIADLSPIVGASLERLRSNENEAIARLDACIAAYDAARDALILPDK